MSSNSSHLIKNLHFSNETSVSGSLQDYGINDIFLDGTGQVLSSGVP